MRPAVLYILFGNVVGGLSYFWMKRASEGLPPFTIAFLRSAIGAACLGIWLASRPGPRWPFGRAELRTLLLTGTLAYAAPLALGVIGTDLSTSANGSILILLEPVSIVAFAYLLLRERVGALRGAGLAIGLGGAALVTTEGAGGGADLLAGEHLLGNCILATHGVLWGLYTPLLAPVARRHAAGPVTFAVLAVASAALLPPALLESGQWSAGPRLGQAIAYSVLMGVGITFLGTLAWNLALRDLPAGVIAPFVFLQPAVGVVAGRFWLGERVSPGAAVGGALVAAGVAMVLFGERRRPDGAAPSGTGA